MKQMIIATAGHVDHGKTTLLCALTGTDADRLTEEKRRGITIDLGFAAMRLSDGTEVDFIDVPGHEHYIKNMLAGVAQADAVLMIVAANEGVMPQTIEHLELCELLGLHRGLVVLTKADIVEEETLWRVKQEVSNAFAGSFLSTAPILFCSAKCGVGFDLLQKELLCLAAELPEKETFGDFCMPVDRVFSMEGFGMVATGVVTSGCLRIGETLMLSPSGITAKARGLQRHGSAVQVICAGQRAAVNLAHIKAENVCRGMVLTTGELLNSGEFISVKLCNLQNSKRIICNNLRVHLFIGTAVVLCRVLLLKEGTLSAGESGYAQLHLEGSIATQCGDHFVLRFYSPLETIGGGVVLETNTPRYKRKNLTVLHTLRVLDCGNTEEQMLQHFAWNKHSAPTILEVRRRLRQISEKEFSSQLERLLLAGKLVQLDEKHTLASTALRVFETEAKNLLKRYHAAYPFRLGMPKAELKAQLFPFYTSRLAEQLLTLIVKQSSFTDLKQEIALNLFVPQQLLKYLPFMLKLRTYYATLGCNARTLNQAANELGMDSKTCLQVGKLMEREGLLTPLAQAFLLTEDYQHARAVLEEYLTANESITLAQYRDLLPSSRKPAQMLLEHFDSIGLTKKNGDFRVLK